MEGDQDGILSQSDCNQLSNAGPPMLALEELKAGLKISKRTWGILGKKGFGMINEIVRQAETLQATVETRQREIEELKAAHKMEIEAQNSAHQRMMEDQKSIHRLEIEEQDLAHHWQMEGQEATHQQQIQQQNSAHKQDLERQKIELFLRLNSELRTALASQELTSGFILPILFCEARTKTCIGGVGDESSLATEIWYGSGLGEYYMHRARYKLKVPCEWWASTSKHSELWLFDHGPSRPRRAPSTWLAKECSKLRRALKRDPPERLCSGTTCCQRLQLISYFRSCCEGSLGTGVGMMDLLLTQLVVCLKPISDSSTFFTWEELQSRKVQDLCELFAKLLQYSKGAGICCCLDLINHTHEYEKKEDMDGDMRFAIEFLADLANGMAAIETAEMGSLRSSEVAKPSWEGIREQLTAKPIFKLLMVGDDIAWCDSRKTDSGTTAPSSSRAMPVRRLKKATSIMGPR